MYSQNIVIIQGFAKKGHIILYVNNMTKIFDFIKIYIGVPFINIIMQYHQILSKVAHSFK